MKIYLTVDEDGYVNGWGSTRSTENDIELDLDNNHEFFKTDHQCWKYVDDELVFDEERQQQLIEEYEREKNKPSETDILAMAVMDLAELVLNGGGK